MKQHIKPFFIATLCMSLSWLIASFSNAASSPSVPGKVYYRYVNEEGVKVLNSVIPPEAVPNGYEVVSLNGEVIKVVDPAPTDEESKRIARELKQKKEQEKRDKLLRRRYSSVADIEAAKNRSLLELQGNISILKGTLSNLRSQILDQQEKAAGIERSGRTVSDEMLKNLSIMQSEEKDILVQIKQRELEYQTASDKFDQDMKRFAEISRPPANSGAR